MNFNYFFSINLNWIVLLIVFYAYLFVHLCIKNNALPRLKIHLVLIFTFSIGLSMSQGNLTNQQLLTALFSDYKEIKIEKKAFIKPEVNNSNHNPFLYLAGGLLFVYQNLFSAQISANCVYEISCSEYTKKSIQKHGIIKGSFIGMHQLSCCTPSIHKDYCEHSISESDKIINRIE